ncbi:MAG: SpoIID/LytB domain-containing protein [Lachnospiraceae bacterium]|nr:SpoIID/LytB domain-containing protein [Lachnospiraceae bacterium]
MRKDRKLSRSERMRLKIWICLLGTILLLFLLAGRLYTHFHSGSGEQSMPHVPQLEKLANVWLIEIGEKKVLLYRDGREESYDLGYFEDGSLYQPDWSDREQVADVLLADGAVIGIAPYREKVHGVILSADENSVEVEGYGHLPLASDYKGYRTYDTLSMCTYRELAFGYDFADLVLKNGEVCGILMVREETMEEIRVLIKTSDFGGNLHEELRVSCDTDYEIIYGEKGQDRELYRAGEEILIRRDDSYFTGERIWIKPAALTGKIRLLNVHRNQGIPGYRGQMELVKETDGFAVLNTLLLEDYLYSVVPSEMPASFGIEALKAQAVCARTYAYGHMRHAAYPAYGAHVDDSTAYQVYNNILEHESTTRAVKETHGQLLYTAGGELAETYYYSTSCGVGSDAGVWKTDAAETLPYLQAGAIREGGDETIGTYLREEEHFEDFILHTNKEDFESAESWYRWTYTVEKPDVERMFETLKKRYQARPELILTREKETYIAQEPRKFSEIKSMYVASRGNGGVVDELILETDQGTYKVITEHNIRYVLCDGKAKVELADGKKADMANLLPSGFFILQTKTGKESKDVIGYTIVGGGFGHGVGMSQNAARRMADRGYDWEQILLFFYKDCVIQAVY